MMPRLMNSRSCQPSCAAARVTSLAHPEGFSGLHVKVSADRMRPWSRCTRETCRPGFRRQSIPTTWPTSAAKWRRPPREIVELQIDGQTLPVAKVQGLLARSGSDRARYRLRVLLPPPRGRAAGLVQALDSHAARTPATAVRRRPPRREADAESGLLLLEDILTVERDASAALVPPRATPMPPAPRGRPQRDRSGRASGGPRRLRRTARTARPAFRSFCSAWSTSSPATITCCSSPPCC